MFRLFRKEIWASRWILGSVYLAVIAFGLMDDPFFFRGSGTAFIGWLMLPFFILGLSAYSGEMANDTVQFLYSRPIKWWKILVAKLLAGLFAVVSTVALMVLVYVIAVPDQYRPFLCEGLVKGLPSAFGGFGMVYVVGFAVSALMPGIALSFASIVILGITIGAVLVVIEQIGRWIHLHQLVRFVDLADLNVAVASIITTFIAGVVIARKLPKLSTGGRWLIASKALVAAFAIGAVLTLFHVDFEGNSSRAHMVSYGISPNGRWTVQGVYPGINKPQELVLVNLRSGKVHKFSTKKKVWTHSWSPDSRKFIYVSYVSYFQVEAIYTDGTPRAEIIGKLDWPLEKDSNRPYSPNLAMKWSPDGRNVAISYYHWSAENKKSEVQAAVVDTSARTIRMIPKPVVCSSYANAIRRPAGTPVLALGSTLFWPPGWAEDAVPPVPARIGTDARR